MIGVSRNPSATILTKEEYAIAKSNGINRQTACSRRRDLKWSVEDAITKPVDKTNYFTKEEVELMKRNRLKKSTVNWRLQNGWERERALTEEVRYIVLH